MTHTAGEAWSETTSKLKAEIRTTQRGSSRPLEVFVAAAFHDIRNLMTNIRGCAQLGLLSDSPNDKDYFSRIIAQVDSSLGWLMAGMDFLRDEETAPVSLADFVSGIVKEAEPAARTGGVTLEFAASFFPAERADICSEHLKRAVNNLLLNAVQASGPGGKVVVRVLTEKSRFVIAVRDWGPGVPQGDRDKIFKPFFTTKEGGTGLGLFIVNYVSTHLHHGAAWFESPPGGGAEFFISLPRNSDL